MSPALERALREARRLDLVGPLDAPVVAGLRTLLEATDRDYRDGVSAYQLAYALDKALDRWERLIGGDAGAASFDELRTLLSAAPGDDPPA